MSPVDRVLRQFAALNALVLSLLFVVPALEALLLRREVTLSARFPLAVLVLSYALGCVLIQRLDGGSRWLWAVALGSLVTLLVGSWFGRLLIDTSWDGLLYHEPAIYELHEGWNPYTRKLDLALSEHNQWPNEYPRAAYYATAVLTGVFGDVDAGKLSFFLAVTTFVAALRVARIYAVRVRWLGFVASFLAVVNPVVLCQLWQLYVDAALYYVLLLCIFSALAYARERRVLDLVLLLALGTFLANIKFTGPVYFLAVLGWLGADQLLWSKSWKPVTLVLASWLVATSLTGFDPYLRHALEGRHVFHPVMGKDAADIVGPHTPPVLLERSWPMKLLYSYVGFTVGHYEPIRVAQELALDGVGTIGENRVDPRMNGFGRYFFIAWLLAVGSAIVALVRRRSARLAFAAGCLLVLGLLNPSAWWARYVPQLWVVPLLLGVVALSISPRKNLWLPIGLAFYLQAVCAQLYLGQSWNQQLAQSRDVRLGRELLLAQLANAKEVRVGVSMFGAHYYWLKEHGQPVVRVPEAQVQCPQPIDALKMRLCVEPK